MPRSSEAEQRLDKAKADISKLSVATNNMNEIDELFITIKYQIPLEEEIYSTCKNLPLDFLIRFGYVSEETTDAHDAFFLKMYYRSSVILDLIEYEKLMTPDVSSDDK